MDFIAENKGEFEDFRKKYPDFTYQSYSWSRSGSVVQLSFTYLFSPTDKIITSLDIHLPEEVSDDTVRQYEDLIFRIGLIEALSYWKAYCSPNFIISCGNLDKDELSWWHDTWYDGMGEFRYRNGLLSVSKEDWVNFVLETNIANENLIKKVHNFSNLSGNLIAFTGGKDSTLVLGLLSEDNKNTNETFFISNHESNRDTIKKILHTDKYPETIIKRSIHPRLLELNKEGALNGHTPFSVIVAFVGMFVASLRGMKYVIVANEASTSEATVAGTEINHQYSKSIIFEKKFQDYCANIWPNGPYYFSLLRPFGEIATVSLLKKYQDTLPHIVSCNIKTKEGLWCGKCGKCVFAFLVFGALWDIAFAKKVVGADVLAEPKNLDILEELTGFAPTKPFDCVGTTEESLSALSFILSRSKEAREEPVLKMFLEKHNGALADPKNFDLLKEEFHPHLIPESFLDIIMKAKNELHE